MKNDLQQLIRNFGPFIKYAVVGVSGTLIDLGSLYVFVEYLHTSVIIGSTLAFFLAVINNFILNKTWTFQNKSPNYRKLFLKFLVVSSIGLGLTLGFMYLFVDIAGIWYMFAKVLTSLIVLSWNFLGNKLWTFRIHEKKIHIPDRFVFDLSIIIPAYNEFNRIKSTILLVDDYIKKEGLNAEMIVVNDGSKDDTVKVIEHLKEKVPHLSLITLTSNSGKGFAIKSGIEKSQGAYILYTDADNSTPIEEYKKLFDTLKEKKAQIAIGSRYMNDSLVHIKQPLYRIILGRVGNLLISLFLIDGIKDTQCGFKLFEHMAAKEIFAIQKVKRFGFDMELLAIADILGFKIVEVPVRWFNSPESRFRPIKDALITFKDLIYIKLNLWGGRYDRDS